MNGTPRRQNREKEVSIPAEAAQLEGILAVPDNARGIVLFAHGSGSGRFSPRNNYVARVLQDAGLGTLLIDLLTEDEANDRSLVFDIDLLARRLQSATDWLLAQPRTAVLRIGYFGASTGAGAALVAAARKGMSIGAIVSRGGRPDLAGRYLSLVKAPTLLIVGGRDHEVLLLNQEAYAVLRCTKDLVVVPGATHLFEESGALEKVAQIAQEWFRLYLGSAGQEAA